MDSIRHFQKISTIIKSSFVWIIIGLLVFKLILIGCSNNNNINLDEELQRVLARANITQLDPRPIPNAKKVELGRLLMHDKILSGNKDISCATCHHSELATGDQLTLSIGTGGTGFGQNRTLGKAQIRLPRHASEVFNRGSTEWHSMFWDSRVSGNPIEGFITPAGDLLPDGLENIVAAQAMFPVTSPSEMRGSKGDLDVNGEVNEIALVEDADFVQIWELVTKRVLAIDEYQKLFAEVYPSVSKQDLGFQHIANAIAAFEIDAWTLLNSPWDRYLAGNKNAISNQVKRGAILFYDKALCADCHRGNLLTDQKHNNTGIPQLGPGKSDFAPLDLGRFLLTNEEKDKFAFRTPPLRNIAVTSPYMHNGAYTNLEEVLNHYNNVAEALKNYDASKLEPALQNTVKNDEITINAVLSNLDIAVREPLNLSTQEIKDLIAFLKTLTDPDIINLAKEIPLTVPSGLPVKD